MFLSQILNKNISGASFVVAISNAALSFSSSASLAGLKDLARQTDIGLTALSAIGMVADGFENRYNPLYVKPEEIKKKTWKGVASCVLGGLLLVDTAAKVGLITISKFSLSVKGRQLTSDAFSTSLTVMVVVVNLLDLNSARSEVEENQHIDSYKRKYRNTCWQVGFKLLETGTEAYFPAQKAASQIFKCFSATFGFIQLETEVADAS